MSVTDGLLTDTRGSSQVVSIFNLAPNTGTGTGGTVPGSTNVVVTGSTTAVTTLSAATSGNGTTVDWGSARQNISMFILVNGTVTGGVVDLQVSQDGTNWVKISSSATLGTGVNQQLTLSNAAFQYARGVVSTAVTGGGTVTATLMSS